MKASYHGHKFEVDSVIGKDGMEYPAQDVVLIEPDWSSFRREAATDILANVAGQLVHDPTTNAIDEFDPEFYAKVAVEWADALIAKLKEK